MRTDCLLPLPTLTFLTSLLAALFARDRLHEAFLDTVRVYLVSSSPLCAAVSLRDSDGARGLSSASTSETSLPLMYVPTNLPYNLATITREISIRRTFVFIYAIILKCILRTIWKDSASLKSVICIDKISLLRKHEESKTARVIGSQRNPRQDSIA